MRFQRNESKAGEGTRSYQRQDFELACRDPGALLVDRVGSGGFVGWGFRWDRHFLHQDRLAYGFSTAGDAEAKPDAESRKEDGDERAVELDGVLDYDEAVFRVLERGDEQTANHTEDEDVAPHAMKYTRSYPKTVVGVFSLKCSWTDTGKRLVARQDETRSPTV